MLRGPGTLAGTRASPTGHLSSKSKGPLCAQNRRPFLRCLWDCVVPRDWRGGGYPDNTRYWPYRPLGEGELRANFNAVTFLASKRCEANPCRFMYNVYKVNNTHARAPPPHGPSLEHGAKGPGAAPGASRCVEVCRKNEEPVPWGRFCKPKVRTFLA